MRDDVAAALAGGFGEGLALMRLVMLASEPAELEGWLAEAPAVARLWRERPEVWDLIKSLQATVDHAAAADARALARAFDRAAALSPDAASALYALGDPRRLADATEEIVALLRARALLHDGARVMDIGCGSGRFAIALAGRAARVLALEASPAMAEAARARCAGLTHVEIALLADGVPPDLPPAGFDLALAVDSFPYIVQSGLAARWFAAVARALKPGGALAIFNYAYRGALPDQAAEAARLARAHGLAPAVAGERLLQSWDGALFLFARAGTAISA